MTTKRRKGITLMVCGLVLLGILLYFSPLFLRARYKLEMTDLKRNSAYRFGHFPAELPKSASQIRWNSVPNFIRVGNHDLFFYADEEYLQEVYGMFAEEYDVYTYQPYWRLGEDEYYFMTYDEEEGYKNLNTAYYIYRYIDEADYRDIEWVVLYDRDVESNGGFLINRKKGYIWFWEY